MISFMAVEKHITASKAFGLCGVASGLRIAQGVNGTREPHAMMLKGIILN